MTDPRFEALEIKTAYLENFVAQLQEVVVEQQRTIDSLKQDLLQQKDLLLALREAVGDPIEQKRPPHY